MELVILYNKTAVLPLISNLFLIICLDSIQPQVLLQMLLLLVSLGLQIKVITTRVTTQHYTFVCSSLFSALK